MAIPFGELLVGLYLGLLAGLFPAFIAFGIGFGFKYFTDVTVPGLGVVVLGGALAGISGGLLGLLEPGLAESWTGISAVLVILMVCLWAHSQGDKLAAQTPRGLTLRGLRESRASANLAQLVDAYGQLRIRPAGEIHDLEGYPPLPEDVRQSLQAGSWRFPAKLSISEIETRLEEQLTEEHGLADVSVTLDAKGRAEIHAAPATAGLSKLIPPGTRGVTIETLLPTGMTRGDTATLKLPEGDVMGPVVSARTFEAEPEAPTEAVEEAPEHDAGPSQEPPKQPARMPTTRGGEGQVTLAMPLEEAKRVLNASKAPVLIHARGEQREFEAVGLLKQHGNRFRKVTLRAGDPLAGSTIGQARVRATYGVAILAINRSTERIIAPPGSTQLQPGDTLIVVGQPDRLTAFQEALQ